MQGDTPAPTEPSLYLNSLPPTTYFVSSFGGFADDNSVPTQVDTLLIFDWRFKYVTLSVVFMAALLRHCILGKHWAGLFGSSLFLGEFF